MKKFAALLTLLCTILFSGVQASAREPWVTIDSKLVYFNDINPQIINGFTYVPARAIYEALGYDVRWENNTMYCSRYEDTVAVGNNDNKFYLYSGTDYLCRGYMDSSARNINGTFMIPVRLISASTRAYVQWIADTSEVAIFTEIPQGSIGFVAHKGLAGEAPENTLASVIYAKKGGFSMTEADVKFTSDGIPVMLHDDTINRTARYQNGAELEREIPIDSISFNDARQYDFGSFFSEKYRGEEIPSLIEYMTLCNMLGIHPIIELKAAASYSQLEYMASLTDVYGLSGNISYGSFIYENLEALRELMPYCNLVYFSNTFDDRAVGFAEALQNGENKIVLAPYFGSIADRSLINYAEGRGLSLAAWTITKRSDTDRLLSLGINTIIADNSSSVWNYLIR